MADDERWELAVTVGPLVEEIAVLRVRCGLTVAEVRESAGRGSWHAYESNSAASPIRPGDYAAAVADARRLALAQERRRLLTIAIDEALESDTGEVGEERG